MSDLEGILDQVVHFLRRFVSFDSGHQAVTTALWAAHTHAIGAAAASPYLAITSAEPESGKTRLFEVLELVVAEPWRVTQPSEAVLFRKIDKEGPTLLLDEFDAIFGPKAGTNTEGLRGLLNASNRRGTTVPRCVGKDYTLTNFKIFCPKALAGIGRLPITVTSRSIQIRLKRRKRDEVIERFRYRLVETDGLVLQDNLAEVMAQHVDDLKGANPVIPDQLGDRASDSWEPLLAIADAAGGSWPRRARDAAIALSGTTEADEQSLGIRLLDDIRSLLVENAEGKIAIPDDRIPTATLIGKLRGDEEAPWVEQALAPAMLARLLKKYDIRPTTVWLGSDKAAKGYKRQDLAAVFERYLDPLAGSLPEGGLAVRPLGNPESEYGNPNTKTPKPNGLTAKGPSGEAQDETEDPDRPTTMDHVRAVFFGQQPPPAEVTTPLQVEP